MHGGPTSLAAYTAPVIALSTALLLGPVPSCAVCCQVLPPRLVHLVVSDSPKAQPLLALTGLQVLVMQGSTMSAQQLTQVNTLILTPLAALVVSCLIPACMLQMHVC